MITKALPRRRLRTLVLVGCAAALTWLVVSRSLAAYLAEVAPQSALWLNPQQPEALTNLADRSFNSPLTADEQSGVADQAPDRLNANASENSEGSAATADQSPGRQNKTSENAPSTANGAADSHNLTDAFSMIDSSRSVDLSALRAEAVTAVTNEPLNPRALRLLGQLADTSQDDASALKFMTAAAHISQHENVALYWLMRKSAAAGDYKTAINYADSLLRTNPGLARIVVPVLAHFAGDKASIDSLKAVLDGDPPWRGLFFALLPESVTDARTPLNLLLALKSSPNPPTADDINRYLHLLVAHKFYDLAYYTWLQFLPLDELRNAGLLFNGSFDMAPSGAPFDWTITEGSGVTVDIVPTDKTGERALMVDFLYGRVDYHSVFELVMLPPGSYQLTGQYNGKIIGPRGLKWRIVCANATRTRLGESLMIIGVTSGWKKVNFNFTVPAADCRAQYVELDLDARMASEQLVSGSMLFNDLDISRATIPPNLADAPASPNAPNAAAITPGSTAATK